MHNAVLSSFGGQRLTSFGGMALRVPGGGGAFDPDASTYIAAVETADGQTLEPSVKAAYDDFVKGCKADGTWDAIKASCIMAGARTLSGALVPLVGTAPTNFNFVSGDYDRKTGLKGDGATKYLDSNRLDSADPLSNIHFSIYVSEINSTTSNTYIATINSGNSLSEIIASSASGLTARNRDAVSSAIDFSNPFTTTGFIGSSRTAVDSHTARASGSNQLNTGVLARPETGTTFHVFNRNSSALHSDARMSFYSIGESVDLAALDTRVSALMIALDGAIA